MVRRHGQVSTILNGRGERQRLLSELGTQQSEQIGAAFRSEAFPVGEVLASPLPDAVTWRRSPLAASRNAWNCSAFGQRWPCRVSNRLSARSNDNASGRRNQPGSSCPIGPTSLKWLVPALPKAKPSLSGPMEQVLMFWNNGCQRTGRRLREDNRRGGGARRRTLNALWLLMFNVH